MQRIIIQSMSIHQVFFALLLIFSSLNLHAQSDIELHLEGKWKLEVGINDSAKFVGYDDSKWQSVNVPAYWDSQEGFRGFNGLGLYRKQTIIPENARGVKLYLVLGKIGFVDEAYINGVMIGRTGNVNKPDDYTIRTYPIPDTLIEYGKENVISVRVFTNNIGGGIYEGIGKDHKVIGIFSKTPMRKLQGQPSVVANMLLHQLMKNTITAMDQALINQDYPIYIQFISNDYFNNGTNADEQKLYAKTILEPMKNATVRYSDFMVYQISDIEVEVDYDTELKNPLGLNYTAHDKRFFRLENGVWLEVGNQSRCFEMEVKSVYMNERIPVTVYLPPSFIKEKEKKYPVLYLLHPHNGSNKLWFEINIQTKLDSLTFAKAITEIIVVMPSENKSFYVNSKDEKKAYENFFLYELPDAVEQDYRSFIEREARGIDGIAWGGSMSFALALSSNQGREIFYSVGGLMPALDRQISPKPTIDSNDSTFWKKYLTTTILKECSNQTLNKFQFSIITPNGGLVYQNNKRVHEYLLSRKIKHNYQVFEGTLNFDFWTSHLDDMFKFHSNAFKKFLKKKKS